MEEIERLFNYKGKEVCICKRKEKYVVGIHGGNDIYIWFDKVSYPTIKLAVSSGKEYARILIDRMLLVK